MDGDEFALSLRVVLVTGHDAIPSPQKPSYCEGCDFDKYYTNNNIFLIFYLNYFNCNITVIVI